MAYKFLDNYRERGARKRLVELLEKKGIEDKRILKAIGKVPRHFFFDETFWNQAYKDIAFPIGEEQTISQPYTVAYQTQLLQVNKGDKVLEIGTGSGYQSCILVEMGADVYTIERQQKLYERTIQVLPIWVISPIFSLAMAQGDSNNTRHLIRSSLLPGHLPYPRNY